MPPRSPPATRITCSCPNVWSGEPLGAAVVVAYGIVLIGSGQTTAGQLIGFLLYVNSFYGPMRQLATVWSSFQLALAALDRISEVLALESDMALISPGPAESTSVLEFRNVSFQYPGGKDVLKNVCFELEKGKAYALVGPTGGGKTTTASLMARLFDPIEGSVFLDGRDIRSVAPDDRSRKVGFIPQEPFLFTGTVRDNIVYGNDEYRNYSSAQLAEALEQANLSNLLARFSEGLDTKVASSGNSISLGQKQLIAFMRTTLRRPRVVDSGRSDGQHRYGDGAAPGGDPQQAGAGDDQGDHRPPSEYHCRRRSDLLRQFRRSCAGRIHGACSRYAAARKTRELNLLSDSQPVIQDPRLHASRCRYWREAVGFLDVSN